MVTLCISFPTALRVCVVHWRVILENNRMFYEIKLEKYDFPIHFNVNIESFK